MNLKIKRNFLLFFIFSLINSKFNQYYDLSEETHYYSLPNEFPTIIDNYGADIEITDLKKKIEKIFGYLPFTEQYLLLKQEYVNKKDPNSGNNNIFNTDHFDNNDFKNNLKKKWQKEVESISYYIEKNEKMLLSGLGCVKTVLQKYGYKTEFNKKLYDDAYEKIHNILEAQKNFITKTNEFLKNIHNVIFPQRLRFLKLITYNDSDLNDKDNFFMDENYYYKIDEIIGIKYSSEDQKTISTKFREYLKAKEEYDIILNKNAMKIIMDISRMDGCRNYDDPDYNAGKSSDTVSSPEITYRHKKIVGINDISGIRNDKKTMNGYDLQHGYYLGTSEYENYRPFPYDFANLILNFSNTIQNISFKTKLDDIYNLKIDSVNFYPNLMNLIHNDFSLDKLTISNEIGNKNNFDITEIVDNDNFSRESFEIYYYKNSSKEYIYYIKINNPDNTKTYYDLVINGTSLGNDSSIIQSCFGVFTSGGKHDKNACRDVLTKDCGINLDYKCKKAGFYDYINANPAVINKNIYGEEGNKEDEKRLFNIFYKHFLLGGIAIRPSAFTGINLILQSYINNNKEDKFFKEFLDFTNFYTNSESISEEEEENEETNEEEENDLIFSIFKDGIEKIQNNEIDKSNYNLISKSNYFNIKLIRIIFTFLFLYLI